MQHIGLFDRPNRFHSNMSGRFFHLSFKQETVFDFLLIKFVTQFLHHGRQILNLKILMFFVGWYWRAVILAIRCAQIPLRDGGGQLQEPLSFPRIISFIWAHQNTWSDGRLLIFHLWFQQVANRRIFLDRWFRSYLIRILRCLCILSSSCCSDRMFVKVDAASGDRPTNRVCGLLSHHLTHLEPIFTQ